VGEYLDTCGDLYKVHLLEVVGMIDDHRGRFNRLLQLYYLWLDSKKNGKDFSHKDGLFSDRFNFYCVLNKRLYEIRSDVKSIYCSLYEVYSGRKGSRIDKCKSVSDRWTKVADECKDIINCMMREYKYFNYYFEKHPINDVIKEKYLEVKL
jgi:hypothetical protein